MDRSYATQVTLRSLSTAESQALACSVATGGLLEPVAEMILRKAEGNPFFIEELTRSVLERGAVDVPGTIHAVLAARIDRLPPETKALLQMAAVLGREFPARMLEAVWESGDPVPHLHELRRRELLYDRVGLDGTVHVFKHALVQDVAYESLLRERRRELHARVLNAIEQIHAARLDEQVDHLARHALRAEIWDKAVTYGRQAGLRATARSAFYEGVQHYQEALEATTHLPPGRGSIEQAIAVRLLLRTPLWILGRFDDVLTVLRDVEKAARELGDSRRLGRATVSLWNLFWITGHQEEWRRLLPDLQAAAEAPDDPALQVYATHQLGQLSLATGDVGSICGALESRLPVADDMGPHPELGAGDSRVVLRALLTGGRAYLGEFREGITVGDEGVEIADSGGSAFTQMYIALWLAWLHAWRGDFGLALPVSHRAVRLTEEHGLPGALPWATATHGWILCGVGRADEGIPLVERALELAESRRLMFWFTNWVALLSEGYLLSGDLDRSRETAVRGLSLARDRGEPGMESWIQCLLGDIAYAAHSDSDTAKQSYRDAMSLAQPLGLRPLIARAHLGLSKLFRRTGNGQQAQEYLTTAITMYREMGMTYWLEKAEAELKGLA
jgi:tetratricopeptide (TPR) repeat protein